MSNISFDNVYLLFLIIPLVAIISVPFALAIRKDNANGHNIASYVIHIIIALLVSFAIAGTTIVSVITATEVYVVADVSYSANRNLSTVDSYIQNVRSALPANSRMGVVAFGRDYQLLTELGDDIVSVSTADVDDTGTDIGAALSYTAGLFHENVLKRIVIITDGKDSDPTSSAELSGIINSLYENNIYVDAIYLDDNLPDDTHEVQISSVDFSSTAYYGRPSEANVVVQSGTAVRATLTLEVSQEDSTTSQVWGDPLVEDLSPGTNVFNFDLCTTVSGTLNYTLTVATDMDDGTPVNNTYSFTQQVVENINVLLIYGGAIAERNAIMEMYGDNADIDWYYINADSGYTTAPCIVEDLCKYDEIVLASVDVRDMDNYASFIDAVNTVVSAYGKSLVTYGNMYIQNQDDEVLSQFEDMLPVRYGNADQDARLVTFVIDNSMSMYQNGQLTRAKEAITAMIQNFLSADDWVSVFSFWGDNTTIQAPIRLGTGNTANEIIEKINAIEIQQGTDIGSGLQLAYDSIVDNNLEDKQLFLFSDGISYHDANLDPVEVVRQMYEDGIYTSAVFMGSTAINDDGTYADADGMATMQAIASAGRGGTSNDSNFYICNADEVFDDVIFGEIANEYTDSVVTETSDVHIEIFSDDVLGEDDNRITSLPEVRGYYYSRAKTGAQTVLSVDFTTNSGNISRAPLYAYWNYGNGRVATFTSSYAGGVSSGSDWSNGWLGAWTADTAGGEFIYNISASNTPNERVENPYMLSIDYSDGYASFELTPSALNAAASATLQITLPDGTAESYNMSFNSSTYTYGFVPAEPGRYGITVTYSVAGTDYVTETYLTVSYLSEYNAFTSFDAAILNRLLSGRGVVSEDGTITITNPENELETYSVSLTMPLLIAAVVLFVVDIVIRKLKWNDVKSLFIKVNKGDKAKKPENPEKK